MAPPVENPTWARVMLSRFVSSSPALDSVLTAQSLEPASDSVSPSLSASPLLALSLSPFLKNKQTLKKYFFKEKKRTPTRHPQLLFLKATVFNGVLQVSPETSLMGARASVYTKVTTHFLPSCAQCHIYSSLWYVLSASCPEGL